MNPTNHDHVCQGGSYWRSGLILALTAATTLSCSASSDALFNGSAGSGAIGPGGVSGTGASGGAGLLLPDPEGVGSEGPADGECGVTTHDTQRLPPNILLVLDRSGSMSENKAEGCVGRPCGSRWEEVTAALDSVLDNTQAGINWGLKYYPDDDWCGVSPGANVPVTPANAGPVKAMYFSKPPVEGKTHTPTREAVAQGATYLAGLPGPNPKVMLLATDGEPNCMAGWKSEESAGKHDSQASIQAVAAAAALGIPVYVVGVATSETDTTETLNAMAVAGLTALDHPLLKYYAVDTSEDLAGAMQSISAQAAACTFTLDSEPPVPDNVAIEGDGLRIAQDPDNGWGYGPDHTTILLHGSACESVKGGSVASVKILFGCPGRPIK